jgi:hypothetical protein
MVLKLVQIEPLEGGPGAPVTPVGPGGVPRQRGAPAAAAAQPKPGSSDRGVTILNERRFQVSMLIYVVRSVPGGGTGMAPTPSTTGPRGRNRPVRPASPPAN